MGTKVSGSLHVSHACVCVRPGFPWIIQNSVLDGDCVLMFHEAVTSALCHHGHSGRGHLVTQQLLTQSGQQQQRRGHVRFPVSDQT